MTTRWQADPSAEPHAAAECSQASVRRAIRRSPVPVRAWADALGCTPRALHMLLAGDSGLRAGPLMDRVRSLLDALHDGRSHWRKIPAPDRPSHPTYRLDGQQFTKAAAATVMYKVDFMHCTLTRITTGPVRDTPLWPPQRRSRAGGLIGKYFPDTMIVGPTIPVRRFPPKP